MATGSSSGFSANMRMLLSILGLLFSKMFLVNVRGSILLVISSVIVLLESGKTSEPRRRSPAVLIAMGVIVVIGIVAIAFVTREHERAPVPGPAAPAATESATVAAVAPSTPAAPKADEAAPRAVPSAANDEKTEKRSEPRPTKGRPAAPVVAPPAPPPTATAPPKKANPLGDRL